MNENNEIRIPISSADILVLERLYYEVETHKSIIALLLENHVNDNNDAVLSSKAFITYSAELRESMRSLDSFKNQITKTYVPAELKSSSYIWTADFDAGEIVITK